MTEREINTNTPNDTTTAPRPWIEPAFERVALHEAMSNIFVSGTTDGNVYAS